MAAWKDLSKYLDGIVHSRILCPSAILVFLLGVNTALLAYSAYVHSPTLNEPGHLVAGICNWQYGRFDLYPVNPPLVRMVAALPVLAFGAETDWRGFSEGPGVRSEMAVGHDFIAANGERSFFLCTIARWACIPFSWLGGVICFLWARDLYGVSAGLLAAAFWCFSPNILGYASLITADVAATALGMAACYSLWLWFRRPSWMQTIVTGMVLGLALLAKTTLIILCPLWLLLWIVYRIPDCAAMRMRRWLREIAMLAASMMLAIYVVNIGYAFEGTCTRLGEYEFVSPTFSGVELGALDVGNRFAGSWIDKLPVPLPAQYVLGIDLQRRDFDGNRTSYLGGQFRNTGGWWYYYLYALAIKVPLGIWGLLVLTIALRLSGRLPQVPWRNEAVLLIPALIIFVFVSSQTGFSEHMRYVLPVFPFVFVWISQIASTAMAWRRLPAAATVVTLLFVWSTSSSLFAYPHNLSYFNELVGGPTGGPRHLLNSNVDWGQDLLYLEKWIQDHPEARPLHLVYFGGIDPAKIGFEETLPVCCEKNNGLTPGWYAVSVNPLHGWTHHCLDGSTRPASSCDTRCVKDLANKQPVARLGYSIFVYHVCDTL